MLKKIQKPAEIPVKLIYPLLLVVYSLLLVNQGITTTDTGYNYGNFVNFESLDGMWKFSTYLATAVGAFFTHLPFGHTMLGLNIYTGLVKAAIALVTYYFCVYVFEIKPWIAFLAELTALGYSWCPTALLYNYCTYFLFTLGGILLCLAVKKERNQLYVLAGVCLGMNVLVRFPNLAEAALIVALWCYCFLYKVRLSETIKRTGFCLAGYLMGVGTILAYLFVRYSPAAYVEGIRQLLAMSREASGYSIQDMLIGDIRLYLMNSKWVVLAMVLVFAGTILYTVGKGKLLPLKRVVYVLLNMALIMVYRYKGMFRWNFYNYDAIYFVGVFFLLLAGLMGLYAIIWEKEDRGLRMHAMVMGIIILVTPLGSNNHLMTAMNNLFFVVPFVLECCVRLVKCGKKKVVGKLEISPEPLRLTTVILVAFCCIQGILFGSIFVFRDGIYGEKRTETITDNTVLSGIYTTSHNALVLGELNEYLNREKLKGAETILYEDVPALAFYMDLKPVLSSTWPDLASFSIRKFKQELEDLKMHRDTGDKPIVIVGARVNEEEEKTRILQEFLEEMGYQQTFSNEAFLVYR